MDPSIGRYINWLETADRAIYSQFPELTNCSSHIAERLSALLLERLPTDTSQAILRLLPEGNWMAMRSLSASAIGEADCSIGYTDFVERSVHAVGCTHHGRDFHRQDRETELFELSRRIVDVFLWAIAQEIPPEIKSRMATELPSDLRIRMNLISAASDDARVA